MTECRNYSLKLSEPSGLLFLKVTVGLLLVHYL